MEGNELTSQAKLAIQKYVFWLMAPAGAGLFLIGFVLNDVARKNAYNDAYSDASQQIVKLAQEVGAAANDASRLTSEVKDVAEEARSLRASLETHAAWVESERGVSEVVDQLAARKDFIERLAFDALGDRHCSWSRWHEHSDSSVQVLCDNGRYIKGVEFTSQTKELSGGRLRALCCNFR